MFKTENEALTYIQTNKDALLAKMDEGQIKTIYTNGNTRINVMKDGKRLLKVINRFDGDKKLIDIYKDMIDLKLL